MVVTIPLQDAAKDSSLRRTLTELSLGVIKSKRIVVVTGAGISCSCGIPDFRSSDGLYALVKERYPNVVLKGRDLFDASLFRDAASAAVFYTFISELKEAVDAASPTPTHQFIKTLDTKKKLLRSYTQNIDGLEERAGLAGSSSSIPVSITEEAGGLNGVTGGKGKKVVKETSSKRGVVLGVASNKEAAVDTKSKGKLKIRNVRNVQLHGDIHRVRCTSCAAEFPSNETYQACFLEGNAPNCPECESRSQARVARSARPLRIGTLRPAIVLYDEPHPLGDEIGTIQSADVAKRPDMLIVMGTSMKVHGLKKLVKNFSRAVHDTGAAITTKTSTTATKPKTTGKVIFVNKTPPGSEWADVIDYHVMGDTDTWVEKVLEDWKKHRPADWEVQTTLVAGDGEVGASGGGMRTVRVATNTKLKEVKKVKGRKPMGESTEMVISPPPKPKRTKIIKNTPQEFGDMVVSPLPKAKARNNRTIENHPPSIDMIISPQPKAAAPPSPSKRRTSTLHYNDPESSPSKRHTRQTSKLTGLEDEARRLLFKETTNARPIILPWGDDGF